MTWQGWLFLALAWGGVAAITVFSFRRVLRKPDTGGGEEVGSEE